MHSSVISPFSEQLPFNEMSLRFKTDMFDTRLMLRFVFSIIFQIRNIKKKIFYLFFCLI